MRNRVLSDLSRVAFHHAFKRFQSIHRKEDGHYLASFRDPGSYVYRTEDYKEGVARQAELILGARRWVKSAVGRGEILRRVIAAIEQPGNNLLQWDARFGPQFRVHVRLLAALENRKVRREFEAIFFDLYARRHATADHFEHLAWLCGKRYELIAYLFFVADRHRFLPIRTTSFDRCFEELGFPLRTARQCSWPNYSEYLDTMTAVRVALDRTGIGEVSLLDAHSFCWVLGTYGRPKTHRTPPRIVTSMRHFAGLLLARPEEERETESMATDSDEVVNMVAVVERRGIAGDAAEEIALGEERRRLTSLGRPDLARRIRSVSDRPALGYDIYSFERNGRPRHIEVKSVSGSATFFLSRNEWRRSRSLPNYWFYLVRHGGGKRPEVMQLESGRLAEEHLVPTQYLVRFRFPRDQGRCS